MPYSKIDPDKMILRDHLAYDRTVLANERTLLSYFRTAISLLAGGGALVKFFADQANAVTLGLALISMGVLSGLTGIIRFVAVRKRLSVTYRKLDDSLQTEI